MPGTTKTRLKLKTNRILLILIVLVLVTILALILWRCGSRPSEPAIPEATVRPVPETIIKEREVEKLVEVEKEITAEMLQEGLNNMGVLVTQEYFFTEVVSYSSIKTLFHLELGITASSFLASYDGVVTAGIDFNDIRVEKDPERALVTVTLPRAEILNVDIDPNSFELYSEKEGLGNPISMEDYNNSLLELEESARGRAIERGILDKADANAETVIKSFVFSLIGAPAYTVQFVRGA